MARRALGLVLALAAAAALFAHFAREQPEAVPLPAERPAPALPTHDGPTGAPDAAGGLDAEERSRVRVLSGDLPLAGATVAVGSSWHHGRFLVDSSAQTDADGWAPVRASGEATLVVSKDYFRAETVPFAAGQSISLEPLPPARGRVQFDDGRPARGARVMAEDAAENLVTAGPDGRFELRIPHPVLIVAELDGAVAAGDSNAQELTLTLEAPAPYVGKVVDNRRQGLAGVAIEVVSPALTRTFTTAADGTWHGTYPARLISQTRFHKEGFLGVTGRLPLEFGMRDGPVVLHRPAAVEGTVRTRAGVALENVELTLEENAAHATTDARGAFALRDLSAERPELILTATHGEQTAERSVALVEGETVRVEVAMPPERREVELDVVDPEGEPVRRWSALATPIPPQGWESHSTGGPLLLAKGKYRLVVRFGIPGQPGTEETEQRIDDDGRAESIRVVVAGARRRSVRVTVRTATGVPVGQAEVWCGNEAVSTREDGTCDCPLSRQQTGAVVIRATLGEQAASATLPAEQDHAELVLAAPREVQGTVVGALPQGAYLTINSSTQMTELPLTGPTFTLTQTAGIRAVVCVNARGPKGDEGRVGCAVLLPDAGELTIPVGATGTVELTLLDVAGQPLEQPIVYVDRELYERYAPNGKITLTLTPGTHVVVVNAAGSPARAEAILTVRSGEVMVAPPLQLR